MISQADGIDSDSRASAGGTDAGTETLQGVPLGGVHRLAGGNTGNLKETQLDGEVALAQPAPAAQAPVESTEESTTSLTPGTIGLGPASASESRSGSSAALDVEDLDGQGTKGPEYSGKGLKAAGGEADFAEEADDGADAVANAPCSAAEQRPASPVPVKHSDGAAEMPKSVDNAGVREMCETWASQVVASISADVIRKVSLAQDTDMSENPAPFGDVDLSSIPRAAGSTAPLALIPQLEFVKADLEVQLEQHTDGSDENRVEAMTPPPAQAEAQLVDRSTNLNGELKVPGGESDVVEARTRLIETENMLSEELARAKVVKTKALLAHEEAASIAEDMRKQRREAEAFTSQIAKIKQQYEDQLKRTYSHSAVLANQEAVNSHGSDVNWKQKAIDAMQEVARMKAEMEVQLQQIRREQEQLRIRQVETTVKDAQVSCSCSIC